MLKTPKLKEHSFLVYGLGITGNSVINYFKKKKISNFKVYDDKRKNLFQSYRTKNLNKTLKQVDYIILSPGISLNKNKNLKKYKKKIITAITVKEKEDKNEYKKFTDVTDIYLFDSKGYENSMSFNHALIENLNLNKEVMIAGNIQIDDDLENLKKIAHIIDISGGLETDGLKDISKIDIFLNKMKNL